VKRIIQLISLTVLAGVSLSACVTRPAPEAGGRWKPLNQLPESPQEIPLYESYVFYVSPLDGTLKNTVTRWAKDAKMTLSYQHPSDFTLHQQAADAVRSANAQEAASQLSAAYAGQRVLISINGNQISVTQAVSAPAAAEGATQ
jgi:hypothetical protein